MSTLRLTYFYKRDASESLHGPGWDWDRGVQTGTEEEIRAALMEMQEKNAKARHHWEHYDPKYREKEFTLDYCDFEIQEIIPWAQSAEFIRATEPAYHAEKARLEQERLEKQAAYQAQKEAEERTTLTKLAAKYGATGTPTEGGVA